MRRSTVLCLLSLQLVFPDLVGSTSVGMVRKKSSNPPMKGKLSRIGLSVIRAVPRNRICRISAEIPCRRDTFFVDEFNQGILTEEEGSVQVSFLY